MAQHSRTPWPMPTLVPTSRYPYVECPGTPRPTPCLSNNCLSRVPPALSTSGHPSLNPPQFQLSCQGVLCTKNPRTMPAHAHFSYSSPARAHPLWSAPRTPKPTPNLGSSYPTRVLSAQSTTDSPTCAPSMYPLPRDLRHHPRLRPFQPWPSNKDRPSTPSLCQPLLQPENQSHQVHIVYMG